MASRCVACFAQAAPTRAQAPNTDAQRILRKTRQRRRRICAEYLLPANTTDAAAADTGIAQCAQILCSHSAKQEQRPNRKHKWYTHTHNYTTQRHGALFAHDDDDVHMAAEAATVDSRQSAKPVSQSVYKVSAYDYILRIERTSLRLCLCKYLCAFHMDQTAHTKADQNVTSLHRTRLGQDNMHIHYKICICCTFVFHAYDIISEYLFTSLLSTFSRHASVRLKAGRSLGRVGGEMMMLLLLRLRLLRRPAQPAFKDAAARAEQRMSLSYGFICFAKKQTQKNRRTDINFVRNMSE